MTEPLLLSLVEASVRAAYLAALVASLLSLLRVPSGAPRHTAWLIVLVAMIAMPLLQQVSPALPALPARVPDMTQLVMLPPVDSRQHARGTVAVVPPVETSPVEDVRASAPMAAAPLPVSTVNWTTIVLAGYGLVAVGLLLRLLLGLYGVRMLLRGARRLSDRVYESDAIATPITVGALRPRVLLPIAARQWTEETRRAVLAHECAHARRRDPLVALLVRFNRCIFWFHPLSWWLQRQLLECAEHACDEAALRAVPEPRRYAEVLLAMAEASRRAGGRLAWAGAHAHGGTLSRRLDRILQGGHSSTARVRQCVAALGCGVLVAVVACQSKPDVPPLAPPEMPAEMKQRYEASQREHERALAVRKTAQTMTWEQVAQLEAAWRRDREDLETLEMLLYFYEPDISGKHSPDDPKRIAGRRPLILWLIEHHPDSELVLGRPGLPGRIFGRTDWLMDPVGYEAAKKLWLAHAARHNVSAATLRNAAWFLDVEDKPLAEQLLLQGQRLFGNAVWPQRLGRLYAQAIVGSNRFTLGNVVNSTDPTAARGEFAAKAKATLEASSDASLLVAAGEYLVQNARMANTIDRNGLARTYLDRALQLDPTSERARYLIDFMNGFLRFQRQGKLFANVPAESRPGIIANLPDDERLVTLVWQTSNAYLSARSRDWHAKSPQSIEEARPERVEENRRRARVLWEQSKAYARDALSLAQRLPNHPDHADAVFAATVALGTNAFREGDRQTAVLFMLEAAEAPPSTLSRRTSPLLDVSLEARLIGGLLQYGERETVIRYFEKSAENRPADRERLLAAATAIRNGRQPTDYERR